MEILNFCRTKLFNYFISPLCRAVKEQRINFIKDLIHLSASFSDFESVARSIISTMLMVASADVNCVDREDLSVIHVVTRFGNYEMVESSINSGADVNARDRLLRTPLCYVADKHLYPNDQVLKIAKKLLENKANGNASDINGVTPLHLAVGKSTHEVLELTPCSALDHKIVRLLIEKGADINALNVINRTPIMYILRIPRRLENSHSDHLKVQRVIILRLSLSN